MWCSGLQRKSSRQVRWPCLRRRASPQSLPRQVASRQLLTEDSSRQPTRRTPVRPARSRRQPQQSACSEFPAAPHVLQRYPAFSWRRSHVQLPRSFRPPRGPSSADGPEVAAPVAWFSPRRLGAARQTPVRSRAGRSADFERDVRRPAKAGRIELAR